MQVGDKAADKVGLVEQAFAALAQQSVLAFTMLDVWLLDVQD